MELDLSKFLNIHKNKLLSAANSSDVRLERMAVTENNNIFTISVKGTPLQFHVRHYEIKDFYLIESGQFDYKHTLIKPGFPLSNWSADIITIDKVCAALGVWLNKSVKQYYQVMLYAEIPNHWSELQNIQPLLSSGTFTKADFEMFTDSEKKQIRDSISEFQRLIKDEISPVKEDLKQIQEKLEYLTNAINRLNRFDWKGVALSTVIGIATNMSVDVDTGQRVMELFRQSFNSVIRLLPK